MSIIIYWIDGKKERIKINDKESFMKIKEWLGNQNTTVPSLIHSDRQCFYNCKHIKKIDFFEDQ